MKRKLLAAVLIFAMLFTCVPTMAMADTATATSVRVGQVTLENGEYTTNGTTKTAATPTGIGYAYYTGGVLKLNNFEYEGTIENDAFIYTTNDLDIELIGDSIIKDNSESAFGGVIFVKAELNIYGGGSLAIRSLKSTGIRGYGTTAKNVTFSIVSGGEESFGLQCTDGTGKGLSLENVTANIAVGERGMSSATTLTIKNCDIDIEVNEYGIWANNGIEITNSNIVSLSDYISLHHNTQIGKITLTNGHYVLEGNSDEYGAIFLVGNTLELPTSDFYYRTEKNTDFVKNSVVPFEYNKDSKEKYIEIFTDDRIIPVEIEWSADTSFTYDGTEKSVTAVLKNKATGDDVVLVLTNAAATNAGDYTAEVTGLTGKDAAKYTFAGVQNLTKDWEITKATPTYTTPTGLTAIYGQTLADVTLPTGFAWQDATTTSVGDAGTNTFKVTFTPADTTNYEIVKDIDVNIVVSPAPQPTPTPSTSSGGGFSGSYNYPVSICDTDGAAVTLSEEHAIEGETVTITVTPESGKQVDDVIVTDEDGEVIAVTKVGDNKYTFTMPKGKVNVIVTTEAIDYDNKIVLQIGNTNVVVDGKLLANDVAPLLQGERTLVPIRVIIEALGGSVDWNEATRTVTIIIDGKVLTLVIDRPIPGFGQGAAIMDNRTYVPIRYVAEYVGAHVEWITSTQQIVILK